MKDWAEEILERANAERKKRLFWEIPLTIVIILCAIVTVIVITKSYNNIEYQAITPAGTIYTYTDTDGNEYVITSHGGIYQK